MSHICMHSNLSFLSEEKEAYPGVIKIAEQVMQDIYQVTGQLPGIEIPGTSCENLIIYGTLGHSPTLDRLAESGIFHKSDIENKWEVYSFQIVDHPLPGIEHALIIAGSDKRGTIYGLYHLSELLGVSPLTHWNHVQPAHQDSCVLTDADNLISKEPSVKYRGIFINDEWPAFGTWATEHFGGLNAACYEQVFELLLRLKGNYLWPAMWNSNFSLDGPGIESARLADEYGIVMSTSHHEPCMRSGEEFQLLKKTNPAYGDAWNFQSNREGVTNFWRDGLQRNKAFENVITMGMRGERDTAIMGKEATLADNITLLRDVLHTQNELIQKTICSDLNQVPRQIVLFTEVEEFFYGNENTPGLMNDPELEGVTLMLSDNNHGYTRTLPNADMRAHKGGYGMYYHMDMHGGAHAYEWIGSTYLPKLWEQMTMAYDYGVREIWVANVGDIGSQEYGLSFFLDLAYDMDKWGGEDAAITTQYTKLWVERHFNSSFSASQMELIVEILQDYTALLNRRKHETMNADVYHPLHFGEANQVLEITNRIERYCQELREACPAEHLSAFISLVYYPAMGTANLMKMWILAGRNKLYARQNRIETNLLPAQIDDCVRKDRELVDLYHEIDNGKYYGFGLSEHIGFRTWNEEDNQLPIKHFIYPAHKPRILISRVNDEHYMTGLIWNDKKQTWTDTMRPDTHTITFTISNGSDKPFPYTITTDCTWLHFSQTDGIVNIQDQITLSVDKTQLNGDAIGTFTITNKENQEYSCATITVQTTGASAPCNAFLEHDGYICMKAKHFNKCKETSEGAFKILSPYGRTGSGIKVFPTTTDFTKCTEKPLVSYDYYVTKEGDYQLSFYMAASTPVVFRSEQFLCFSVNDEPEVLLNTVENPAVPFFLSAQWSKEALSNVKLVTTKIHCKQGYNTLHFYAASPALVLEKIVLCREGLTLPSSYLGPTESAYIHS